LVWIGELFSIKGASSVENQICFFGGDGKGSVSEFGADFFYVSDLSIKVIGFFGFYFVPKLTGNAVGVFTGKRIVDGAFWIGNTAAF